MNRRRTIALAAASPPLHSPVSPAPAVAGGALVVTESEAAQMLRLSPRTMQRMRLMGGGPAYVNLTPNRIGYPLAALQAWVAARTVGSTSAAAVAAMAPAP